MRVTKNNRFFFIWSLAVFILINGCSFHRVGSDIITDARFKNLDKKTEVELIYNPATVIYLAEHSEFFTHLNSDEASKYRGNFSSRLAEKNIWVGGSTARFVVTVREIVFTEKTHEECHVDEKSQKKYCFWLNNLDITVNATVFDRHTHKSKNLSFGVTESTKIKSRFILKGYKEGSFFLSHHDYVPELVTSCLKKIAGKTAKVIRKAYRKDGRAIRKKNRRENKNKNEIDVSDSLSFAERWDRRHSTIEVSQPDSLPLEKKEAITIQSEPIQSAPIYENPNLVKSSVFVDYQTGDTYETKQVENTIVWMVENLRTPYFKNGDSIPESKNIKEWNMATKLGQPTWMNYKNSNQNGTCGKMYNWFAVIDSRGLAPQGWHVTTEDEWVLLIDYWGGFGGKEKHAGYKLKSTKNWSDKTFTAGNESTNGNGNNKSELNCLPCGQINKYEGGYYYGKTAYWWVALQANKKISGVSLNSNGKIKIRNFNPNFGYSVRCVKDSPK